MAETNRDYESIERPYNAQLERTIGLTSPISGSVSTNEEGDETTTTNSGGDSGTGNGSVENMSVKSEGGIGDVWITNFIRSQNWKPKSFGFMIDGQTGYAEFTNVFISGNIEALTGTIGGWKINASNLSATNIFLDSGNQRIQVGASTPVIIDGATKSIQSDNYVSGAFGAGFYLDPDLLEVGNIAARGMIRTAVFQKDVISAVGGSLVILDSDVLEEDMSADD